MKLVPDKLKAKKKGSNNSLLELYNALSEYLSVIETISNCTSIYPIRACAIILGEDLHDLVVEVEEYLFAAGSPLEFESLHSRSLTVLEEARTLRQAYQHELEIACRIS